MANLGNIIEAFSVAVKTLQKNSEHDDSPDVHLFLNETQNKITITVDYPINVNVNEIGVQLLEAVKEKLKQLHDIP